LYVDERRPGSQARGPAGDRRLPLHVIYTRTEPANAALRQATLLAAEFDASLTIVATQVVPYPLPLSEPPVSVNILHRELWSLVADIDLDVTVQIYLCRDPREALSHVFPKGAVLLLGATGPRWWPSRERRLARALDRAGHAVFLVESI
jgi:hypothetical protein